MPDLARGSDGADAADGERTNYRQPHARLHPQDVQLGGGVPHVGTHGIRHRAATDIANSGVSVKIGMALTAHETAAMFMRYVHAEDDPLRAAAEKVANLCRETVGGMP